MDTSRLAIVNDIQIYSSKVEVRNLNDISDDALSIRLDNLPFPINTAVITTPGYYTLRVLLDSRYELLDVYSSIAITPDGVDEQGYHTFLFNMPDLNTVINLNILPRRHLHGIEFEQNFAHDLDNLIPPTINDVTVEILDFVRGIYRITISVDDCTLDPRAVPFFFWQSQYGTFEDEIVYRENYAVFTFLANPNTANQNINLILGVGDGLGQVARRAVILKGNDSPENNIMALFDYTPTMRAPFFFNTNFMPFGAISFPDVPTSHWAYNSISNLVAHNAISGFEDGTFRPEYPPATVQEFIAIVARVANVNLPDVDTSDSWAARYIQFANDNDFLPPDTVLTDPITRELAFFLLYSILTHKDNNIWNRMSDSEPLTNQDMNFTDLSDITPEFRDALNILFQFNVARGFPDGSVLPGGTLSRADMATILFRAITPSGELVTPLINALRPFPHLIEHLPPLYLNCLVSGNAVVRGTRTYRFVAPMTGYYMFTSSNDFAPLIFIMHEYDGETYKVYFETMHQIPEALMHRPNYLRVKHHLEAGQIILVTISGEMYQFYTLIATTDVPNEIAFVVNHELGPIVNGQHLDDSAFPLIRVNGHVMIPLDMILKSLQGARMDELSTMRQIEYINTILVFEIDRITFTLEEYKVLIPPIPRYFDVAPHMQNGLLYVQLRPIFEALGFNVFEVTYSDIEGEEYILVSESAISTEQQQSIVYDSRIIWNLVYAQGVRIESEDVSLVDISTGMLELEQGNEISLIATVYPQNSGSHIVRWETTDSNVVNIISVGTEGRDTTATIRALRTGSATITAINAYGDTASIDILVGERTPHEIIFVVNHELGPIVNEFHINQSSFAPIVRNNHVMIPANVIVNSLPDAELRMNGDIVTIEYHSYSLSFIIGAIDFHVEQHDSMAEPSTSFFNVASSIENGLIYVQLQPVFEALGFLVYNVIYSNIEGEEYIIVSDISVNVARRQSMIYDARVIWNLVYATGVEITVDTDNIINEYGKIVVEPYDIGILVATVYPPNSGSHVVHWESSDLSIAEIDGNGRTATIHAISQGTATITARNAYGQTTSINVLVPGYIPTENTIVLVVNHPFAPIINGQLVTTGNDRYMAARPGGTTITPIEVIASNLPEAEFSRFGNSITIRYRNLMLSFAIGDTAYTIARTDVGDPSITQYFDIAPRIQYGYLYVQLRPILEALGFQVTSLLYSGFEGEEYIIASETQMTDVEKQTLLRESRVIWELVNGQSVRMDSNDFSLDELDGGVLVMEQDDTFSLNATIYPTNVGSNILNWSSSNPSVVQISGNGRNATIRAIADGRATITVSNVYGQSAVINIRVGDEDEWEPQPGITVFVEDAYGLPISGATVHFVAHGHLNHWTFITDSRGIAHFPNAPASSSHYGINVTHPDFTSTHHTSQRLSRNNAYLIQELTITMSEPRSNFLGLGWSNILYDMRTPANPRYQITSIYGYRAWSSRQTPHFHGGIDINEPALANRGRGRAVYSISDGIVIGIINSTTGGHGIVIRVHDEISDDYFYVRYLHLLAPPKRDDGTLLRRNDSVIAGEQIGELGNSGDSENYHLHIDIHRNHNSYVRIPLERYSIDPRAFFEDGFVSAWSGFPTPIQPQIYIDDFEQYYSGLEEIFS